METISKNILILDGHPDPDRGRLCHALAQAYRSGAESSGHDVRQINVSDLSFPVLRTKDEYESGQVPPDIKQAQDAMRWCNHMMIIYPLWLGTMPALLKAFLEQMFRPDFAFDPNSKGWPRGNLSGKTARIVVTMGMPGFVYRWFFWAHSLKSLERNVLKFAGIKPIRQSIYGMVDTASDAERAKWISEVRELGRRVR